MKITICMQIVWDQYLCHIKLYCEINLAILTNPMKMLYFYLCIKAIKCPVLKTCAAALGLPDLNYEQGLN